MGGMPALGAFVMPEGELMQHRQALTATSSPAAREMARLRAASSNSRMSEPAHNPSWLVRCVHHLMQNEQRHFPAAGKCQCAPIPLRKVFHATGPGVHTKQALFFTIACHRRACPREHISIVLRAGISDLVNCKLERTPISMESTCRGALAAFISLLPASSTIWHTFFLL
jgi:hypothetical protein